MITPDPDRCHVNGFKRGDLGGCSGREPLRLVWSSPSWLSSARQSRRDRSSIAAPLKWQTVGDENSDEIEDLRQQKMTALREAREAYRHSMLEPARPDLGSLFAGRRSKLQGAVKAAEAELRQFDRDHPRT